MGKSLIKDKLQRNEYDLSSHAHTERQNEQITVKEIEQSLLYGDIIEVYSQDPRGKSCLVAFEGQAQPLHVICGLRNNRLLIVTVYRPKLPVWTDYKTRAKELKSRV